MGPTNEIRDFLQSRRAAVSPESAGLPAGAGRRVTGLRREEVAVLAGVSVDYYVRIERGHVAGASDDVLHAIARALRLDDAETAHLFDLVEPERAGLRHRRRTIPVTVRPGVQRILDAMVDVPAWVRNERMDFLGWNPLGRALYAPLFDSPLFDGGSRPVNNARFTFLDPAARDFYADWAKAADDVVAVLRGYTGRNPSDAGLQQLVGELATSSDEFARRWGAHHVKYHRTGVKRMRHPIVGALELQYESLEIAGEEGLAMFAYYPTPGSPAEAGMRLLASWAATEDAAGRQGSDALDPTV